MRFLITFLVALLIAGGAAAQTKDPMDYSLKTYAFTLAVALLGGLVSWWAKVRRNEVEVTSIMHLIGELATAAFAGLLAFWLCEWGNVPSILNAPLVGIAGHMGTRAISLFEESLKRKFPGVGGGRPPPQ